MNNLQTSINTGFANINTELTEVGEQLQSVATKAAAATTRIRATTTEAVASVQETSAAAGEGFGTGLALVAGAFATLALEHLKGTFEEAQQMADQLHILSAVSGNTVGQLQQLFYALGQVGVNSNTAQYAMSIMAKRIEQAAVNAKDLNNPIIALGLNAKQLVTEDTITQFEQISDAMLKLKDRTEQVAIATELFGGRTGGARMIPFLLLGSKQIAESMGQIKPLDPAVDDSFFKLYITSLGLTQKLEYLKEEILAPLAEYLIRASNAVEKFIDTFRNISASDKMAVLFGLIGLITASFVELLDVVGRFLAESIFIRNLIDIVKVFGVELRTLGLIATIVAASWKSNFAGIRTATLEVFSAIKGEAGSFGAFWNQLVATFKSKVGPAFEELSVALSKVVKNIADTIVAILSSKTTWDAIAAAANAVTIVIVAFINVLTLLSDSFSNVSGIISTVFVFGALNALKTAFLALVTSRLFGFIGMIEDTLRTALIDGGLAIRTMILDVLTLGGTVNAVLPELALLAAALYYIHQNYESDEGKNALLDNLHNIATLIKVEFMAAVRDWLAAMAHVIELIADLVRNIPIFGSAMASTLDSVANHFDSLAAAADRTAASIDGVWKAQQQGPANATSGFGQRGYYPPKPEAPEQKGGGTAELPSTEKAKDTFSTDFLEPIKLKIDQLKESITESDDRTKRLKDDLKALGDVDTPAKLAAAMSIYREQLAQIVANHKLLGGVVVDLNAELNQATARLNQGNLAAKDRNSLEREILSIKREISSTETEYHAIASQVAEVQKEEAAAAKATYEATYEDTTKTWAERLSAVAAYRDAVIAIYGYDAASLEVNRENAKLIKEQADDAVKLQKAVFEAAAAQAVGAAQTRGGGTAGTETNKLTDAQIKLWEADRQLEIASLALLDAQSKYLPGTQQLTEAQLAMLAATKADTEAMNELATIQYQAAHQFDDELMKVAQHVGGPLYTVFSDLNKVLVGAINNILQLGQNIQSVNINMQSLGIALLQLFQQSQAFKDIENAVSNIMQELGRVFDALRPVVDLLLGVLIGVVNVFVAMYDVIARLLSDLGLSIQTIQLLNSNLQNMNAATVPLINIVHNLPTLNQANSGVWGNLVAQNQKTNVNILQGFDKTLAKLGEIVGFILGIIAALNLGNILHWIHIATTAKGDSLIIATLITTSNSIIAAIAATAPWSAGVAAGIGAVNAGLGAGLTAGAAVPAVARAGGLGNVFSSFGAGAGGGSGGGGNMSINIEHIHGTDPDTVRSQLGPVFDELMQKFNDRQARFTRTSNYSYGRFGK